METVSTVQCLLMLKEANELAMAMRMLANNRFLHIEFQTSSFCLGNSRHFSVYRR